MRDTERRAREAEGQPEPEPKRFSREVHPDLAEALAAAEDTLTAAFGRPVKVRARGDGCRVELEFDTPGEAVELAERILSPRPPARRLTAAGPPLQSLVAGD